MLSIDAAQGRYGEHLVQLLVTSSGYTCYKPDDTGDGIDLVISRTQHDGESVRPPNVEIQVKTVRAPRVVGDDFVYDMEVPHYNNLRAPGATRRFLVLVVVPGEHLRDWWGHAPRFGVFRTGAYWQDLLGEPATANQKTIAVHVPQRNRYTPDVVVRHMDLAKREFDERFGVGA